MRYGIVIIMSMVILVSGCIQNSNDEPSIWMKGDVISNFENAEYLKVNIDATITFNEEIGNAFTLSEIDYVNDKIQVHYFLEMGGNQYRQDYYREGNILYKYWFIHRSPLAC